MNPTAQLVVGAIGMASLVAGTLFARFWRRTGDRFFLFFAASFWLEDINRFLIGLFRVSSEDAPTFYLIRFAAYALILIAIADKNRLGGRPHT